MGRKNTTAWSVGNPVTSARLNAINADMDDLYQLGTDRMRVYRLATDPALQVTIGAGAWRVGDSEGLYNGGTLTVANSVTTLIMIDNAGNIQTSTSAWNPNYAKLAMVTAAGGVITSIVLTKNDAVGGLLAGKGIPDMRASVIGTPGSYAVQAVTGPEFRPQAGADVGKLAIPGMDGIVSWWTIITYGNWTTGDYSIQVAYSNSTTNGQNYIFMRRGTDNTTWGTWVKVFPLDGNFLDIYSLTETATFGNIYDYFPIGLFGGAVGTGNRKITLENLLKSITSLWQTGSSSSQSNNGYAWTTSSVAVTKGGLVSASISGIYNSGSAHPNPLIQWSANGSTGWTTVCEIVPNNTNPSAGVAFVKPGYTRGVFSDNGYTSNKSFTVQIF